MTGVLRFLNVQTKNAIQQLKTGVFKTNSINKRRWGFKSSVGIVTLQSN